jgi:hypothetical protein
MDDGPSWLNLAQVGWGLQAAVRVPVEPGVGVLGCRKLVAC